MCLRGLSDDDARRMLAEYQHREATARRHDVLGLAPGLLPLDEVIRRWLADREPVAARALLARAARGDAGRPRAACGVAPREIASTAATICASRAKREAAKALTFAGSYRGSRRTPLRLPGRTSNG